MSEPHKMNEKEIHDAISFSNTVDKLNKPKKYTSEEIYYLIASLTEDIQDAINDLLHLNDLLKDTLIEERKKCLPITTKDK